VPLTSHVNLQNLLDNLGAYDRHLETDDEQVALVFFPTKINMNKIETIPAGKTLYHGTQNKFPTGFPIGTDGIWFSTNPLQSILHVGAKGVGLTGNKIPLYFYIYKTAKPIRVLKFDSSKNMNNWAKRHELNNGKGTFAFSNRDYKLAQYLCAQGVYDGWWFPNDQAQVMLCKPAELMKFVKVMEITFPYGRPGKINFSKGSNTGQYVVSETGRKYKYKLINTSLNQLINIRAPPKNAVYSLRNRDQYNNSLVKLFNNLGRPLKVTVKQLKSPKGFKMNGKLYFADAFSSMYGNQLNTLMKRISNQTSTNVSPRSHNVMKITILTPNQKKAKEIRSERSERMYQDWRRNFNNYQMKMKQRKAAKLPTNNLVEPKISNYNLNKPTVLPLPEPHKSMNNININSSALYL